MLHTTLFGLPQWLSSEESVRNAGDTGHVGSIPGSGRSAGGGHGNPLQCSCLENPMDGGAWQTTQSVGSGRVRHNWSNLACMHTPLYLICWNISLLRRLIFIFFCPFSPPCAYGHSWVSWHLITICWPYELNPHKISVHEAVVAPLDLQGNRV